jgi:hypothetical protein
MAYTIGSMLWIAAAILLFPYAYTPRDGRPAQLVRRGLLIGLAIVIGASVAAEVVTGGGI